MRDRSRVVYRERVSPQSTTSAPIEVSVAGRPRTRTGRVFLTAVVFLVAVAAYIGAAAQMTQMVDGAWAVPVAWAITAVQVLPSSMAACFPRGVWVLTSTGFLLGSLSAVIQGSEAVPWPAMSCLAGLASLGAMAVTQVPAVAWIYGMLGLAIPVAAAAVTVPLIPVGVVIILACGIVVIAISSLYGRWRAARHDLWIERLQTEEAKRETALVEERNRIARELHDVVAHHVSMIAVQAQAAQVRYPDADPRTTSALADIHRAADTALTEMRTVVDGLRNDGDGAPVSPVVADVKDLVTRTRRTGVDVTLREDGTGPGYPPLPEGVSTAAYRIVQESVTNAVRHAAGSPVDIRITRSPDALTIEVRNRVGRRESGAPGTVGKGLVGMQERVRIFGGRFDAGVRDGSFVVSAAFPLPADAVGGAE
jgi:signal transduction histidine kinase